MDRKKLRTRSDGELDRRGSDLTAFVKVLDEVGLEWWLGGGASLGATRQQDFIPWDWDLEVHCRAEDGVQLRNVLPDAVSAAGFVVNRRMTRLESDGYKLSCAREGGTRVGLLGFALEGDMRWRMRQTSWSGTKGLGIPARMFAAGSTVQLRGAEYRAHHTPEEYCAWAYGPDWRTPIRTSDKQTYMSAEFRGLA